MPINSNIPMSYQAPNIQPQNVLADYAAIQQIQGGQQANQLNQMKMQEYERARTEEEGLRNFLAQADLAKPETRANLLRYGKTGAAYNEALTKQETAALTQRDALFKLEKSKSDFIAQAKRDTSQNPSDANLTAFREDLIANPLFNDAEKTRLAANLDRILAMPVGERRAFMASQGASASELKPSNLQVNQGGQTQVLQMPAFGGAGTSVGTYADVPLPAGVEAQRARIALAGRPPAAPRPEQPPVAVIDPVTGKQVYVTREEALKNRMTPASASDAKALNEGQANSVAFGMRMKSANAILEDLAKQGVVKGAVIEGAPLVGGALGQALPSFLGGTSAEQQQVNQAKSNFITAVLRKESGASISPSEFANEDKKYFPQFNDSDAVIKQKAKARELAIKAIEIQAGPGAKNIQEYDPRAGSGEWKVVK